jgi:sulfite reductase (NADPH) hemoprotein beta-component
MPEVPLTPVEKVKAASRLLRGTLAEGLADPVTGAIAEDDTHVIKFHGSYQQDDRDLREERRLQKLEPAFSFMIRTRLPAGICSSAQWLALSALAREGANGTLRLTTRQAFQLHGILKRDLKTVMQRIHAAFLDTLAACGDVNRNVMASATPVESEVHAEAHDFARRISEHLLPRTHAYREIWLDGERVRDAEESEPVYGRTYLPRKFKIGIAVPPDNDVDVFSQDLGFIAIVEGGRIAGFNVTAGGGMGTTHQESATFARLGDVLGFVTADQVLAVAEAVVTTQRDFGDRTNRKHARLKYTIADRGVEWFRGEVERRSGLRFEPARPFAFTTQGDRFGWTRGIDGLWNQTLRIESGRVADRAGALLFTGLASIAAAHAGGFRLTPNQNLVIARVQEADRTRIDTLVRQYGLDGFRAASPVRRDALACVALPSCGLAMAEAERYLPRLVYQVESLLARHALLGEPLALRITGCPNGCARPFLAEVALVGKAPGRYNLFLGGDGRGERLTVLHLENADEPTILATLDGLLARHAAERAPGERFGDFLWRRGLLGTPAPPGAPAGSTAAVTA